MDLPSEAARLRLDLLAVEASGVLTRAGLPHALLKGPSTATWLYDPPRRYHDVDLLVRRSDAERAAAALDAAGVATARSGGLGEEASHALLLHSPEGHEVDLHVSLPAVPEDGDRIWSVVAPHVTTLTMDVGEVPALDEVGRCLVLALHAVGSRDGDPARADLTRARAVTGAATWVAVDELAERLGVADLVAAGIARVEGVTTPLSPRARLWLSDAPEAALGLRRLLDAPRRDLPRLLWREAFPTRGFLAASVGEPDLRGRRLIRVHLDRWLRLVRQLPAAVVASLKIH